MREHLRAALGGAAAGALATIPMSAVMLAAEKAGLMGKQPPELVAEKGFAVAGAQPSEPVKKATAVAVHFGFGAVAGALFGLLSRRNTSDGSPIARGIGYGLAVYTASYAGWIPAAGIMPAPPDDRPGRQPSLIAAHVVFGAVLAALIDVLIPEKPLV
ncbi:MAG: DUF6789 family protein [Gemmatimonadaceae bacterium]